MIGTASHPILYKQPHSVLIVFKKFQKTAENYPDGVGVSVDLETLEELEKLIKAYRVKMGMDAVRKELGR